MTIRNLLLLSALAAAMSLIGIASGIAAADTTAAAFAKGGAFCFDLGGQPDGQFQHLKLVAEVGTGSAPFNVIPVHGVERGSWKGQIYENALAGTATESAPAGGPGTSLHVMLTGGGNSVKSDGSPEIWLVQYTAELASDTLAGQFLGYQTESASVADGKPFASDSITFIRKDMTPMDCTKL